MNDFETVKSAIDFKRYTEQHLTVKGKKALCIFHDDHDPSMHIYADSYHCFQCGASGDIFDLHMKLNSCTKAEALEELARYAGITLAPLSPESKAISDKRERIYAALEASAQAYHEALYCPFGIFALKYLRETRGLSDDTIKAARLGYSPNGGTAAGFTDDELVNAGIMKRGEKDGIPFPVFRERIMIPITDMRGRVVGFSGRATLDNQQIKYLYNTNFEKSKTIHVLASKTAVQRFREVVTVEGSLDPISALNRGVCNVVSQLGSALSEEQFLTLSKMSNRLIFCYDNDAAGKTATLRLGDRLQAASKLGVELYVMSAPFGKDPDDTFREHPELWQPAVDAARPLIDVLIEMSVSALPANAGMTDKSKEIERLLKLMTVENPLVTRENREKLAAGFNVRDDDLDALARMANFDIRIVVRNHKPNAAQIQQSYPPLEMMVLNGILVNDDQRWIDRAAFALSRLGDYPKALCPISLNDFVNPRTRSLMSMVARHVEAKERPVDAYIEAEIGSGPLNEVYGRVTSNPDVQAMFKQQTPAAAFVLSYAKFLNAVYALRWNRLDRELAAGLSQGDVLEWASAKRLLIEKRRRAN